MDPSSPRPKTVTLNLARSPPIQSLQRTTTSGEPLTNRGVLDAFVKRARYKATAHNLAAERYETYSRFLKTPSTVCLVALLSVSGFAEVTGAEVMNLMILILSIIAALARGVETLLTFETRANAHAASAERLDEFADNVLILSRRPNITEDTTTKVVRMWHRLKCVKISMSYEQEAAKIQDINQVWLEDIKRRHSLSEEQRRNALSAAQSKDVSVLGDPPLPNRIEIKTQA